MLIEIESIYGDKLIHGGKIEFSEIKFQMQRILESVEVKDFLTAFCAVLNFEELPYDKEQEVDYVIDLDTLEVYRSCRK